MFLVALRENDSRVEHMNLRGNHFGPKAMMELADLVRRNSTLLSLSFDDCTHRPFEEPELDALVDSLRENKTLLHLYGDASFAERCGGEVGSLLLRNQRAFEEGAVGM